MKLSLRIIALSLFLVISVTSREKVRSERISKPAGTPNYSVMNINGISAWYSSDGESERNPVTANAGLTFPRGTSAAVYASGLMIGAVASDGVSGVQRVTGYSYNKGFQPGAILGIRTGAYESPSNADVRIFRIRKDYATADLLQDAADVLMKSSKEVTPSDIAALRAQYRTDWQNWPAAKGAPFYDADHDGIYTPKFKTVDGVELPVLFPDADEPGLAHADQVLWYVCNDIGPGQSPWKTQPLGLEQQVTIWGYNAKGVAGNILYKRYRLIYKGTAVTPENSKLNNMYIAHWSDPDLGDAGDDFAGCDKDLGLGFVYNSKTLDSEYRKFNLVPPALGYDFLQGPVISSPGDTAIVDLKLRPGMRNLPMTSFIYFASGGTYTDPPFTLTGSSQWYQMLRGLPPTPDLAEPLIDPTTGQPTFFWLSGDPVRRTGWIDGMKENPGDRRMIQSSGPITMALGDTQEVVVGVVAGMGTDYLNSVTAMKTNDRTVQAIYNSLFTVIPPSLSVTVEHRYIVGTILHLRAQAQPGAFSSVLVRMGDYSAPLFDDGNHRDSLPGDGIWADTLALIMNYDTPFPADLEFVTTEGKAMTVKNAFPLITTAGPLVVTGATILFDNVNNNGIVNNGEYVEFQFLIKNNLPFNLTGVRMTLDAGSTSFTEVPIGSIAKGAVGTTPGSGPLNFRLPVNYADSNYRVRYHLTDDKGNLWDGAWDFPVAQIVVAADTLSVTATNIIGKNDATVTTVVYDRTLAGKPFQIWFGGNGASARDYTVIDPSDIRLSASIAPPAIVPFGKTMTATGKAMFTINSSRTQAQYSLTVLKPAGTVTGANICTGSAVTTGLVVHQMVLTGTNVFSGTWDIPDSLTDELISGNLYVNILTSANPTGESRGQIADGSIVRRTLGTPPVGLPIPFTQLPENRLVGYSVYVGPAPTGAKAATQTAPTVGPVLNTVNPEGTYLVADLSATRFNGKAFTDNVQIKFILGTNYAVAVPTGTNLTASSAYVIKVPFAFFKDTTRIWPIITDAGKDSVWNTRSNVLWNGKPVFDRIFGAADVADASLTDLRYYSTGTVLSTAMKGRLITVGNLLLKDITIVNMTADSIPPASGTTISFTQYQPVVPGDVKGFTLKTLGIVERITAIPSAFDVSQNYPNPFNPSTTIEFAVPHRADVAIKVYDVVGREVATLVRGMYEPGRYRITWDGRSASGRPVSSGVYFCRVRSGGLQKTVKMLLLK